MITKQRIFILIIYHLSVFLYCKALQSLR